MKIYYIRFNFILLSVGIFSKQKQTNDWSDQVLIEKYRQTIDKNYVAVLFERYQYNIYGVAMKYLNNREDAKDCAVEIFELLTTQLQKEGKDYYNFKSWLYVITKNHCLMKLRKEKRLSEKKLDFFSVNGMESEENLHYLDKMENEMVDEALFDCLKNLKIEQKDCITLFYFDKLTYKDIALKLKITEKSVKSQIQNGKRNLKICLETKHEVENLK